MNGRYGERLRWTDEDSGRLRKMRRERERDRQADRMAEKERD